MKKILSIIVAVVALVAIAATPALAAHGSCRGGTRTARYSVCVVENCTLTGVHYHDGVICAAHYYGDGHDYHEYCDIANCALSGYHEHDDVYCFGHTANDGHAYHYAGRGHH